MAQETGRSRQILELTGLESRHFADLVRTAQLVDDSDGSVTGRLEVDWEVFEISPAVASNLKALGARYRHASPSVPIEVLWEQMLPATRSWLMENRNEMWRIEEVFPALDED
jgi:hypothetical protein